MQTPSAAQTARTAGPMTTRGVVFIVTPSGQFYPGGENVEFNWNDVSKLGKWSRYGDCVTRFTARLNQGDLVWFKLCDQTAAIRSFIKAAMLTGFAGKRFWATKDSGDVLTEFDFTCESGARMRAFIGEMPSSRAALAKAGAL